MTECIFKPGASQPTVSSSPTGMGPVATKATHGTLRIHSILNGYMFDVLSKCGLIRSGITANTRKYKGQSIKPDKTLSRNVTDLLKLYPLAIWFA